MASTLVIVESPAKAKTIGKFLGRGYKVRASMGHVRDLPKSRLGVEVESNFEPKYITIRGKGDTIKQLRSDAKKADRILLATDPDREGEAISWHLATLLGVPPESCRIQFHEVTKSAVRDAIKRPRAIDERLVDAQQARRILDRLVGYKLSPLLWRKVRKGLSAGRVQSVAVRLITDREVEIDAFVPEEYWSVTAQLKGEHGAFEANLLRRGKKKLTIGSNEEVQKIVSELDGADYRVDSVKRKERRRRPYAPFTTSTLQQSASRALGFGASKTMRLAQQLYEGIDVGEGSVGLITYMRTDSTNVSKEAQEAARALVRARHGAEFVPDRPNVYKSRKGAQEAHEAIRPTSVDRTPEMVKPHLKPQQFRLYQLIWRRFVASQMAPAVFDTVSVDIAAKEYLFRATGSTLKFPGFTAVYEDRGDGDGKENEERKLPPIREDESLACERLVPEQHFTQPPPRYTEAALVKSLEEMGIGRPSTYAAIIETIQKRGYVVLEEKRFVPTELGNIVVDLLQAHFPQIVDVEFTAEMEERLDAVEEGSVEWKGLLQEFYSPFEQRLNKAYEEMEEVKIEDEETDEVCERCGRNMVIKWGRYGKFLACPGFPDCRNTKPILEEIGVDCPDCGKPLVQRRSRKGRLFYGCSGYPECEFTSWDRPVPEKCRECGGLMVQKGGRGKERHVCTTEGCPKAEPKRSRTKQSGAKSRNGRVPVGARKG